LLLGQMGLLSAEPCASPRGRPVEDARGDVVAGRLYAIGKPRIGSLTGTFPRVGFA